MRENFRRALADHRLMLMVCGAYLLSAIAELWAMSMPLADIVTWAARFLATSALFSIAFLACLYLFITARELLRRPERGAGIFKSAMRRRDAWAAAYVESAPFISGWVGSVVFFMCSAAFLIQKSLIRFVSPYAWDPDFAAWDKALHFGVYPHSFLRPVVEASSTFESVLAAAYPAWLVVMYLFSYRVLFCERDADRRMRYLWTFVLSWIVLGSFMANILSSVGPAFYSAFYPGTPDPYTDLNAYLQLYVDRGYLVTLAHQKLTEWAHSDALVNPNMLSAMPSMHVAIAWLMVLYAFGAGRALFAVMLLFCLMILLGAVYFGFHYAIDGYVSIGAVGLLWWAVGLSLRPKRMVADAARTGNL